MPRPQGGYNLEAISNSAEAVTRALVGEPLDIMRPMRVSELGNEVVYQVVKMQSQFWRCLRGKRSAPIDCMSLTGARRKQRS
jgi:histone deacetylase 6